EREYPNRRGGNRRGEDLDPQRIEDAAVSHGRRDRSERRLAAEVPLRGPAPAPHAAQYYPAVADLVRCPAGAVRAGLSRDRDAVHDAVDSRRRARLPGAEPRAARLVLRAAAIAADLQTIADGQRLRQVLSDCTLLSRRGFPRRPPGRIHADRSGDVVS